MTTSDLIYKFQLLEQRLFELDKELNQLRDEIVISVNKSDDLMNDLIRAVLVVIDKYEVNKKSRILDVVLTRHYLRFYLKENTSFSMEKIAYLTGSINHSTVLHSIKVHEDLIETSNEKYLTIIDKLQKEINSLLER